MKLILSVASLVVFALSAKSQFTVLNKGETCKLPSNSLESTCINAQECYSLWSIIINKSRSAADVAFVQKHVCGYLLLCCPDNVMTTTTTQPRTTSTKPRRILPPSTLVNPRLSDLKKLETHRNIHLINQKCGSAFSLKISGGKKTKPGDLPWMVLLKYKTRNPNRFTFDCGGSLISSSYVLSAAHCTNEDLVEVRLNEHTISKLNDCFDGACIGPVQDIVIEESIQHDHYNSHRKINDIALLKLATAADLTKKSIRTICLPTTPESQLDEIEQVVRDAMIIAGWGTTESGGTSDELLMAFVPFMNNTECIRRFTGTDITIHPTYLCAGGINRTDACPGDSGGPIQTFGIIKGFDRMVQYGIVASGIGCSKTKDAYPSVYTNIAYYLEWILDNMEANNNGNNEEQITEDSEEQTTEKIIIRTNNDTFHFPT